MRVKLLLLITLCSLLASCETSRYHIANDHAPVRKPRSDELVDAIPTGEKPSIQGNRPYTVRGKRYYPINPVEGYTETGEASWYGSKFHGHLTANGEVYDMFKMTAAHTTLPLPSYIKVTNLNTSRSVVVRVNDRGPFHHKRILDLSYAAAYKIGLTDTGIAQVKIELITEAPQQLTLASPQRVNTQNSHSTPQIIATPKSTITPPINTSITAEDHHGPTIVEASHSSEVAGQTCDLFNDSLTNIHVIQLLTTASFHKLHNIAKRLPTLTTESGEVKCFYQPFDNQGKRTYRLLIGPFNTYTQARNTQQQLRDNKLTIGFIRKL